ncbi:MAG: 6-bladed beta-propeller [Balneolaceae bacterium]|nr:6-bladed beta-propeller [Balneolaceae bacterium]
MSQAALMDSLDVPDHVRQLDSLAVFDAAAPPRYEISFQEEVTYGSISRNFAPAMGGFGPETAVDDSGMVYRTDRQRKNIRIYNPDGSQQGTIGRNGRGPGEFVDITSIMLHDNRLYAYDPNQMRIQVFSLHPAELDRVINIEPEQFGSGEDLEFGRPIADFHPFGEEQFLAGISQVERDGQGFTGYYVLDGEGERVSDRVVEVMQHRRFEFTSNRGMAASMRLPGGRTGVLDVTSDGMVYHANTGEMLIRVLHSTGDYQRSIWYSYENDPMDTQELVERYGENMYANMPSGELPDVWPAIHTFFVDDEERIWISTITDDKENYSWWILSNHGELLSRFSWTVEEELHAVRDGHLYVAVDQGEAMDIDRRLVRYEFSLESPNP